MPCRFFFFFSPSFFLLLILQHRDTQETLAVLERLDLDTEKPTEEELARKFGYEDAYVKGKVNWWQHLKPKLWSLMDEPYSSFAAKVKISLALHFFFFRIASRYFDEGKLIAFFSSYFHLFFYKKERYRIIHRRLIRL